MQQPSGWTLLIWNGAGLTWFFNKQRTVKGTFYLIGHSCIHKVSSHSIFKDDYILIVIQVNCYWNTSELSNEEFTPIKKKNYRMNLSEKKMSDETTAKWLALMEALIYCTNNAIAISKNVVQLSQTKHSDTLIPFQLWTRGNTSCFSRICWHRKPISRPFWSSLWVS